MQPAAPATQQGRGRRIAFRILAGLFAAGALGGLFGIGLVIGWFDTSDGKIHRVHDIAFGVVAGVFLAVGFVAQLRRPEAQVSARYQIVAASFAALIAGLMASDAGTGLFFFLVSLAALAIMVAVHPAGLALMKAKASLSGPLATLAAVGAVPLVWFALTTARMQRTGFRTDPHVKMGHWTMMTAMLLAILLVALLASLRLPGWRITAWCAGLGAFVYGLASAVFAKFPNTQLPYPGSKGVGWGLVAMAGGVVFVAVAEWEARRRPVAESV
jgi:hypothetical protein